MSLSYLSFLILIPISSLVIYSFGVPIADFLRIMTDERVVAAFRVSFSSAFIAAMVNMVFGFFLALVLARYTFFGKRIIDAFVDLPFAIPSAVAGIALSVLFSPDGFLGRFLSIFNVSLGFSRAAIIVALIFAGFPFVVRTVQPVIEELDEALEDAAASLGANYFQIFFRVIFPSVLPALLAGTTMAFARGLGEYGSVIFISSNMPYETEIVPLLIVKQLMQFDYLSASAIGVSMLVIAFVLLLAVDMLQNRITKRKST